MGEPKEILKFLDYHLGLQGAGEDHRSSIIVALEAVHVNQDGRWPNPVIAEYIEKFNCTSPSFVKGTRSIMRPDNPFDLRDWATGLIVLMSSQWFGSPTPIMEPEEMSEFCEHLAVFAVDDLSHGPLAQRWGVTILFEMLRSPEWRKHVVTRFWNTLAYCTLIEEGRESFRWCLRNAVELLEFTRGLSHGEGLRWWYGTLWFHFDKLDTKVRDEVESIARDMSLGDGLSDLNLYLNLIGQEVTRTRKEVDELPKESKLAGFNLELRARLIALEGNYHRLARIAGGQ